jgi:hypothetical protein
MDEKFGNVARMRVCKRSDRFRLEALREEFVVDMQTAEGNIQWES